MKLEERFGIEKRRRGTFERLDDELFLAGLRGLGLFAGQIVRLGPATVVVVIGVMVEAIFIVIGQLRLGLFHRRGQRRRGGGGAG